MRVTSATAPRYAAVALGTAAVALGAMALGADSPARQPAARAAPKSIAVAFTSDRARRSAAVARTLRKNHLALAGSVFRGHRDWNVWNVKPLRRAGGHDALSALERTRGVKWAEASQSLAYRSGPGARAPAAVSGPLQGPVFPSRRRARAAGVTALAATPCTPTCPPPPTTCTGAGGLDAGTPNDPLYCGESSPLTRPFYTEQWNNFCFVPATQAATVTAAAPNAPGASGICADGAWRLGAQGQGTVIAILDSGVNYNHEDLTDRMVTTTNDPALSDPDFPGAIHGWNFYDDNPDPMDYYGHGTGRAGLAAASADNGKGVAGVAPRSLIMALKVGDTYVVHSENLAQGVVYAADHGADVINTSLGAVGNSRLLRLAATYATSNGVFWSGATANEYSTHHNYPTNLDGVDGAGGLGPDAEVDQAMTCQSVGSSGVTNCVPATPQTTFLQKVNYANFGGILDFATPIDTPGTGLGNTSYSLHQSGTSTAAPHLAGAGAIVRGAGLARGYCQGHPNIDGAQTGVTCNKPTLSANEVKQVLAYTATRVHNDDAPAANNYPAGSPTGDPTVAGGSFYPEHGGDPNLGWNIWAGYGRPDLYAATAYAQSDLIPPEAQLYGDAPPPGFPDVKGPVPFALLDPAKTPTQPIVGHVAAPRLKAGESFSWKVQVAPCLEPVEADFQTIATDSSAQDGVLANWALPASAGSCDHGSVEQPFSYAGTYTIRVLSQVTKAGGAGFDNPVATTDPNPGLPATAPLYGQDRRVVFIRHSTADHAGSPYYLGAAGEGSPVLYDLEGRGELDTVEATADGTVVALRPDGTPVPGWPASADDLSGFGPDPHIAPIRGENPTGQIVSTPAIGDVDGDGQPEVVASSLKGGVYVWHRDGTRAAGFPVQIPPPPQDKAPPGDPAADICKQPHPAIASERYVDYGSIAAPVLANLEDRTDGKLDILQAAGNGCVYARKPDGSELWTVRPNATGTEPAKIASTPGVGDLDGDSHLDVVVGTEEVVGSIGNTSGRMYAFDGRTGNVKTGWPVTLPSLAAAGVPTVATGVISSPALFPSTTDAGKLQVAGGVFLGGTDPAHSVFTINSDGSTATTLNTDAVGAGSNFTDTPFVWAVGQTAVGKLGSSDTAIVTGGLSKQLTTDTAVAPGKKTAFQHSLGAYDAANGQPLATFPRQIEDWQFLSGPAIADVKGDGTQQVLGGSGGGFLHAFDPAGAVGAGGSNLSTSLSRYQDFAEPGPFPVFEGTGYITSTPAVGQLRRGGKVTVASVTRDGYLFLTDTDGKPEANDQWWKFHHDERNSGLYGLDARPPATVDDLRAAPGPGAGTASVSWTEVGDDWWVGKPKSIDLRWSTSPISDSGFASARSAPAPGPGASGAAAHAVVEGLPSGRVYLAERSVDDAGNRSLIARTSVDIPAAAGGGGATSPCSDRQRPRPHFTRRSRLRLRRRGVRLGGSATDTACGKKASVSRVLVTLRRVRRHRCYFLNGRGRLSRRSCRRPIRLKAKGSARWSLRKRVRLGRGRYRVYVSAVDAAGNSGRARSVVLRVR